MTMTLDLATILFVLQTSYVAGALALAYARFRSSEAAGAELIALGFLLLAGGALLAGYAEEADHELYSLLSLINIALGMLAYPLFLAGAVELSCRVPFRPRWLVFVPPLVTVVFGLLTGFHEINWLRATVFNASGAVVELACAWVFLRDGHREQLPARRIVVITFAAAGIVAFLLTIEFATGRFIWPSPALGFVFTLALKFAVALSVMILAMERAIARLDRLAHTDPLTGLNNRRFFFDAVPQLMLPGDAIVLFDADRFKKLNDTLGHVVGDEVLLSVARALSSNVRAEDVLARYGGEEFILYLPQAGDVRSLAIADAMRAEVARLSLPVKSPDIGVSVSAGVGVSAAAGTTFDQLIRLADNALYEAKAAGGNTCRLRTQPEPAAPPEVYAEQTSAA